MIAFTLAATSGAQTFKVLHAFKGGADGSFPGTPVTLDTAGNIYGQNDAGGIASSCDGLGCGSVWELSPVGSNFVETTLFDFSNSKTGGVPAGRMTLTSTGDLLGVTAFGGGSKTCSGDDGLIGCGEIFQLAPSTSGRWKQSLVYAFNGNNNGGFPPAGLVSDGATGYYGTTQEGGPNYCSADGQSCGAVYHLTPNGSGGWQQTLIFSFPGGAGGFLPNSELVMDAAGNLYGTAEYGGDTANCSGLGCGVVYELSPISGGAWQQTILYSFTGKSDGSVPLGGLVTDAAGNLYGTAVTGGNLTSALCKSSAGCGVIFELSPVSGGGYTETVLHVFTGAIDGAYPGSTLTRDAAGNLYGVVNSGGNLNDCQGGCGVAYKLVPVSGGGWKETELHVFTGGPDGAFPTYSLTADTAGNLYGVAGFGGNLNECTGNTPSGCGVVFEITP